MCKYSRVGHSHARPLAVVVRGCSHVPVAEVSSCRGDCMSRKISIYDPLQKKFTNACLKGFGERQGEVEKRGRSVAPESRDRSHARLRLLLSRVAPGRLLASPVRTLVNVCGSGSFIGGSEVSGTQHM